MSESLCGYLLTLVTQFTISLWVLAVAAGRPSCWPCRLWQQCRSLFMLPLCVVYYRSWGYVGTGPGRLCVSKTPTKPGKCRLFNKALDRADSEHPVFYVDEADVDLNPRIGHAWMPKGQQAAIPTPGKNQKRYLAGALNSLTGQVAWVADEKKNSFLFVRLLAALRKNLSSGQNKSPLSWTITSFTKSGITRCFLSNNRKFKLLFQPVYHPWVNKIELLWKTIA